LFSIPAGHASGKAPAAWGSGWRSRANRAAIRPAATSCQR
jgi:hypothetical protein